MRLLGNLFDKNNFIGKKGYYLNSTGDGVDWRADLNESSGIFYGGVISATIGGTTFNLSAGSGQVITRALINNDVVTTNKIVSWNAQSNAALTYRTTHQFSYLYIDENGALQQQNSSFTDAEYQNKIIIGVICHINYSTINLVSNKQNIAYGDSHRIYELANSFGPIKRSGLSISAYSTNLRISRAAGSVFSIGCNYESNQFDADSPNISAANPALLCRVSRDGSGGFIFDVNSGSYYTDIDPNKYDNGSGTLQTVNNNKWTIQKLFFFPNNPNDVITYYGRAIYNSSNDAIAAISTESFSEATITSENAVFLGYLVLRGGATDLSLSSDAAFFQSGAFRNVGAVAGGGGGSTITNLDDLTDVQISSVLGGQFLSYDSTTSLWKNRSYILDANNNELIKFPSTVASAVNELTISNAATTGSPSISATGDDTNIGLNLISKGTGLVQINGKGISLANSFTTVGNFALTFNTTATTSLTLPTSGTLATTSQIPTVNNNTLTLAGSGGIGVGTSPTFTANASADKTITISIADGAITIAKLENIATSRILGRTTASTGAVEILDGSGVVSVIGTNAVARATNLAGGIAGQIPYQSGANTTAFSAAGTANQVLLSGGSGAPTWANQSSLSVGSATTAGSLANALTISSPLTGTSYNGSSAVSIGLQNATASLSGGVSTSAQTFGGDKTFANNVIVTGDLTVNGTTVTVNTTTLAVKDKNIELGLVTTPTDVTADGGGITLKGTTDKTIIWVDATDAWTLSEHLNIASGKVYRINGTDVLSSTTLGSGVVNSSLTSVGTLTNLTVTNTITGSVSGSAGSLSASYTFWGQTFNGTQNVSGNLTSVGNITGTSGITITAGGSNQNVVLTPSGTGYTLLNGSVGIGNSTPNNKLTIQAGDNKDSGPIINLGGNAINQFESGRIRFTEVVTGTAPFYEGAYLHYDGSNNLFHIGVHNTNDSLIANDVNAISITRSSANVGIGTTTVSYKLHVQGDIYARSAVINISGDLNALRGNVTTMGYNLTNSPSGAGWITVNTSQNFLSSGDILSQLAYDNYNQQKLFTRYSSDYGATWSAWKTIINSDAVSGTTNYIAKFTATNTLGNSLIFDNGSNVAIGSNATAFGRLQISAATTNPSLSATTPADVSLIISNSDIAYGAMFATYSDGKGALQQRRTNAATYYDFSLQPHGGNVGIGMTTPTSKLHVSGSITALDGALISNVTSGTDRYFLNCYGTSTNQIFSIYENSSTAYLNSYRGMSFRANQTGGSGGYFIFTGANVGIGTVSPLTLLDVRSGSITSGTATSTSGSTIIAGYYTAGALTVLGTEYASGGPMLGYAVSPSTTAGAAFLSSTTIAIGRSAYIQDGGTHRWYIGASQTVAIGSAVTASEVMRININGNVGIGTTNPATLLHVDTAGADARIRVSAGTNTVQGGMIANTNGLVYAGSITNHGFSLRTNDTDRVRIQTDGNVGIGTTSPAYTLQVGTGANSATARAAFLGGYTVFENSAGTGNPSITFNNDTDTGILNPAANTIVFTTNGSERMRLDSTGGINIGTSSQLNSSRVSIADSALKTSAGNCLTFATATGGSNDFQLIISRGSNTSGYYAFQAVEQGVGYKNIVFNQNGGNLGIGTTNPSDTLDVNGTTRVRSISASGSAATIFLTTDANGVLISRTAAQVRSDIGAGTGNGSVTSVNGTGTVSGITLTGTVTTTGSLTLGGTLSVTPSNFASQTANTFLAAPNGAAGTPTFRSIVSADIPSDAIVEAKIANNAVTFAKIQNVTGPVVVGRLTATSGVVSALSSSDGRSALGATTVGANLFTLPDTSTSKKYIEINANNTVTLLEAAAFRTAIGAGTGSGTVTSVTGTAPIASSGGTTPAISLNDAGVTYAKIQNVSATSRILGRITAGAGVIEELTGANVATIIGSNAITNASNVNITTDDVTNSSYYLYFGANASGNTPLKASTKIRYNPSTGAFSATTKSFRIPHPTKSEHDLVYGSLESPYHGIRLTGKGKTKGNRAEIILPDYVKVLIDKETINIQLSVIKCAKILYIDDIIIDDNKFTVKYDKSWYEKSKDVEFYWDFTAERKDVPKLIVEEKL